MYIGGPHDPQSLEPNDNNVFYLTGQTLYDLKRAFPLQGTYHFRCLSQDGDCWIDLIHEQDDLIVQENNTIELKVLDLGGLLREPKQERTFEEELERIEQIEKERTSRPYCIVPTSSSTTDATAGTTTNSNASVSEQAKNVAKKGMQKAASLANKMKGFFR